MESALLATNNAVSLSKTLSSKSNPLLRHLHRHFSTARPCFYLRNQLAQLRIFSGDVRSPCGFGSISLPGSLGAVDLQQARKQLNCVSNSAASFASGGGGFTGSGGNGENGGGGGEDGAAEGGEDSTSSVIGGADDISPSPSEVIILDVGGMTCGGCAASVKRILESQPQVSSASVNLTTETAVVWPVPEAKTIPDWQKTIGEALAKHLTSCGFSSNLRGQGAIEGDIAL